MVPFSKDPLRGEKKIQDENPLSHSAPELLL